MKRSTFLKNSASVLAAGTMMPAAFGSANNLAEHGKQKPIRFAHLTDIHLKAGIIPETGMAKAFQQAQLLQPSIDFILNGGDSIMDAGQFICIISHIPILSICSGLFFDKTEINGDLLIKRNLMHTDFLALKKNFMQYPAIKTCISGHIHLQDEVDYLGIRYFCNGAVSGNWWKGAYYEFSPAFAVMELFDDGTVKRTMMKYD